MKVPKKVELVEPWSYKDGRPIPNFLSTQKKVDVEYVDDPNYKKDHRKRKTKSGKNK